MSKKRTNFYVVWKGVKPGVYSTWEECTRQIQGFEGALYKAFPNEEQANYAFGKSPWQFIGGKNKMKPVEQVIGAETKPIWESISVDAACSGNPGVMEYRGVVTKTGKEIFHGGPYPDATNNIGEFLAIVHCLALLKQKGKNIPIYTDSTNAMSWVKQKKAKTKLYRAPTNEVVFDLIERAEKWLKTNTWDIPVLKWDTEHWGEIPADFGRKK